MAEQPGGSCECGYSEPAAEGDDILVTLRAWAKHVREAHGEDALQEALTDMVHERVEELRDEGKVMRDPFTDHDHWMSGPPGHDTR